jgi:hypothetical protein
MLRVESCLPAACSSLPGRAESDQHHVLACAAAGPFLLVSGFCLKSSGPAVPVHSPDLPCPLVSALGSAAAASSPHTTLLHCSTAPQVSRLPVRSLPESRTSALHGHWIPSTSIHRTLHFCITAGMLLYQRTQLCLCCHLCIFASSLIDHSPSSCPIA